MERKMVLGWINESDENRKIFINVKNLWVLANLPEQKSSDEDAACFAKSLQRRGRYRKFLWSGIAASILVVAGFFIYSLIGNYRSQIHFLENQGVAMLEYKTNKGIKGEVILPDGSKVRLNSDSYIRCPSKFGATSRNVMFSGEGYFEVVKNPKVPMVISLGEGISIKVTGTTFNLSSYKNDKDISALLLTGKITILRKEKNRVQEFNVKPNELASVQKGCGIVGVVLPKETFPTLAWKDGWLVFDETPMSEVIKKLERWHGVTFIVKDPELLNKRFTGKFKEESISQILEMMERVSLAKYVLKDSVVTLSNF